MKRHLVWLGLFAWFIVPVALYAGYRTHGLPHFIWSYDYHGSRHDWSQRIYTRCTFIGPNGSFTRDAAHGQCPWLAFYHAHEAAQ
jgi:hypothetical protein